MTNAFRKRTVAKYSFTSFDLVSTTYLALQGVKTKLLYSADGVDCFEVTLRGRKQLKLLRSEEYITRAAKFDVVKKLIEPRVRPPLYTVKKNGNFAILRDIGSETDYYALSRDPELLGKTTEAAELCKLENWGDLETFIEDVKLLEHKMVRIFVGYGEHSKVPYREIHSVNLIERVIEDHLAEAQAEVVSA